MALEQSRFFDSSNDDRIYQAEQFAGFFRLFLTDGIKNGGENLRVTAGTGMQVKVNDGTALVQGYGYWLEEGPLTLAVQAAEGQPRIDRVVVRLDRSVGVRSISAVVKKGTAAATPSAPALQRDANVWELSLARIAVGAGVSSILSGNITDERHDPAVCGLINSLIELDAAEFFEQATTIIDDLANQGYLPLAGTAADSAKLGGQLPAAYANAVHAHQQSDVDGLATALSGKSDTNHKHSGADITSGTVPFTNIPTGTGDTEVAIGNHNHASLYAPISHSHSGAQVKISYGSTVPASLAPGQIFVKI